MVEGKINKTYFSLSEWMKFASQPLRSNCFTFLFCFPFQWFHLQVTSFWAAPHVSTGFIVCFLSMYNSENIDQHCDFYFLFTSVKLYWQIHSVPLEGLVKAAAVHSQLHLLLRAQTGRPCRLIQRFLQCPTAIALGNLDLGDAAHDPQALKDSREVPKSRETAEIDWRNISTWRSELASPLRAACPPCQEGMEAVMLSSPPPPAGHHSS